ncbi:uncharacterized protein LOC122403782 [Colletes gigas]|uniref:uncharacterized protein LOC122403782 n=1 Tax=Colletes gigas TaxID=935657 RepID=UPI001C9AA444|nr:uncharacterized protein LOC122403782 [Colletes gigas]
MTKEKIERKIKNLLSHFAREVKKEKESMKSGTGADDIFKSKWYAYKSLSFLKDKNKARRTVDTENKVNSALECSEEDSDENEIEVEEDSSDFINTESQKFVSPKNIPSRKRKNDGDAKEAYKILKHMYSNKKIKDEYDLYGEQVAIKIRKLQTPQSRAIVQHLINTTLFEAEMGKYNNFPSFNNPNPNPYTHNYTSPISSSTFPFTTQSSNSPQSTINIQVPSPSLTPTLYTSTLWWIG